ncbi:MAG: hypothetical protein QOI95_2112 [Acidimicrobiaceae bacterium]|jgi:Flp pilus assembly CpaF family ATPase
MPEQLEATLRRLVADEVGDFVRHAEAEGRVVPSEVDQRQMARAILQRELTRRSREALRLGEDLLDTATEHELIERVLASAFSVLPQLEQYLARDAVANIHINGCGDVRLELVDGTVERVPPLFGSNEELIDHVQQLARRGGNIEKEWTPSRPFLDLTLDSGARLAACAWIAKDPYVTIRRHPLVDADLEELADRKMFDDGIRTLLSAAVRARWNLLIAGGQGRGKTTLMRALAHEFDPDERVVVLEQEAELHLDAFPERHNQVLLLLERPPNMEGHGAVTLSDLAWHAKRQSPDRILVGEVRGAEIIPMLEAMTQGVRGSMCTLHADSSWSVFPRLPVYARSGGHDWRTGDIYQLAALALDLVVYVARDAAGRRVVAEIRHVERYDPSVEQPITNAWFTTDPVTGRAVRNHDAPLPVHLLDQLTAYGYEPARHDEIGAWS